MWRLRAWWVLAWLLVPHAADGANDGGSVTLRELAPLPDEIGFAGPFAGTHGGVLLVAGGANFPEAMPWDGGNKVWYDTVYVLESPEGTWKVAGKLPRPLGYGVSLSTAEGVVCLGGSDAQQHYADCFRLSWIDGKLETSQLPSLPRPCAHACGAMLGKTVYLAGGLESPTATKAMKTFWSLDLSRTEPRWQEVESWPGVARMLGVAAVQDNTFYLSSGASLSADSGGAPVREYLRDAYAYRPDRGWQRVADLPRAAVAAPSPAPAVGQSAFLILGGDDGTLVNHAPPQTHPGFPRSMMAYHTITDTWKTLGEMPASHVTTPVVAWPPAAAQQGYVIPSGEIRPGVRSPKVWLLETSFTTTSFGWLNYSFLFAYRLAMIWIGLVMESALTTG